MSTHAQTDEIFIVDDDPEISELLSSLLTSAGYRVAQFKDGESFLFAKRRKPACVILDVNMPGRSGLEILKEIDGPHFNAPIIIMSGDATIPMAVEGIKSGAFDILPIPFDPQTIAIRIRELIEAWKHLHENDSRSEAQSMEFPGVDRLTRREREVLAEITAAASNKQAGRNLGLSPRTVEVHRAHIMLKLGARNTADLVRIVLGKPRVG